MNSSTGEEADKVEAPEKPDRYFDPLGISENRDTGLTANDAAVLGDGNPLFLAVFGIAKGLWRRARAILGK